MSRNSDESKWRDQIERRPYIAAGCDQQGRLAPGANARAQGGSWYTPVELAEFARGMQNMHPQAAEAATDDGDYSPIPDRKYRHLWRWIATIGLMAAATAALIWHDDIIAAVRAAGAAL